MLSLGFGAGKEVRTLDLYLGKVSLYQLSYSRETGAHYRDAGKSVNPIMNKFLLIHRHTEQS